MKDEICLINRDINEMLNRLCESRTNLVESEKKLRMSLDSVNAGIWNYSFKNDFDYLDKNWYRILVLLGLNHFD